MTNLSPETVAVSVAIPAYRNEVALARTLERVFACSPLPSEVLLHFDGGWLPDRDFTKSAPVPVRVLQSSENVGPGGGRHRMIHAAANDLVACFDDDSWPVDRDYFEQADRLMQVFPMAAIMSPAVYLREKPLLQPMFEVEEGVSFEGSASVTRRSHYLKLPGYVPVANAYGVEEADISLQVHAAGFQILNSAWLRAWHDRPYSDYQHGLEPWIRNEVLLATLRYPRWLQPWGWLRGLRHIWNHATANNIGRLLRAFATSPGHCVQFKAYRRRYTAKEISEHHFAPRRRWRIAVPADDGPLVLTRAEKPKRALFVQYTNPAGYPPLQHSSQFLAREGWEIHFAGIAARKANPLAFPPHPRIHTHQMPWCSPGFRQKLHYLRFVFWTASLAWKLRPDWVYASDPNSALPARVIRWLRKCGVVYHEHDSPVPGEQRSTWWTRIQAVQRLEIARTAEVLVLPNQHRLEALAKQYSPKGRQVCVWNCAASAECRVACLSKSREQPLTVLYHGSIVPERFPVSNLEALAKCGRDIRIRLIGYETHGSAGYTEVLKAEAARLGVADRFEYLGTIPLRSDLMRLCGECDAGLCLLRIHGDDINMLHMAGASNKPFDYLSQCLALIVPDDPEWMNLFVENGCGIACKPSDADALAAVFVWMDDHRDEVRALGQKGQTLVASQWNYEAQFKPVLEIMSGQGSL